MFGNNKPFGTASTFGASTFGSTPTPFGQTTNTFGAKPATGNVFGNSTFGVSTPSAPISGGLFGSSTPAASTSLFGQPSAAFGAPASTSTGGGFGFGAASTSSGLFGATTPSTQSSGGLFGNTSASAFGSPRPAFGGFGTNTSTGSGLFGQTTNTGAGLFGTTAGFAGGGAPTGTTIKFNPPNGTDTMMKGGVSTNIGTRHQCISCMKEYENKSLEELRMEDYAANRKGGSAVGMGFGGAAQPQTNLFGAPAPTATSAFSFGATTQAKPLFGTTGQTNTFGSGNLFGQPVQNQNAGLFGKTVGFGNPATSTAPVFNFGAPTSTSLFGQTNQQKPLFGQTTGTTGLFGNPATTQSTGFGTSTGFGAFGAANQQTAGLFGAKPTGFGTTNTTPTTNTFSFGNTNTMNGGGLFGQKPAAPAFGTGTAFGTTSTGFGSFGTASAPGTSLFGQTKPVGASFGTAGNMFGGNLPNFGAPAFNTGFSTNTGTGLFGAASANKATGFTFGNTGASGFNFGGTNPSASSLTFGAPTLAMPAAGDPSHAAAIHQAHQQILAMTMNPFGDSPLFRNSIKDTSREAEVLKPTNPSAQKALLNDNQYKMALLPTAKIKPKAWSPVPSGKMLLFDGLEDEEPGLGTAMFLPKRSVKKLVLKNINNTQSSLTLTSSVSPNQATRIDVSISLNKMAKSPENNSSAPLTVGITNSDAACLETQMPSKPPSGASSVESFLEQPLAPNHNVHFNNSLNDSIAALHTNKQTVPKKMYEIWSESDGSVGDPDSLDDGSVANPQTDSAALDSPHPTRIRLTQPSYYTTPTLDEMIPLLERGQKCPVKDFVVGREDYGKVIFPGYTNVFGLNIDEIVIFGKKEINVYPDEDKKPPVGEGLNRRATVILENVWPIDKTNHELIKDPERVRKMGYKEKIERCSAKLGATFIDYKPDTGTWIFEVDHFSKYSLDDSDEETEQSKQKDNTSNKTSPGAQRSSENQIEAMSVKFASESLPLEELKRKPIYSFNSQQDQEMEALSSPMTPYPLELIEDEVLMRNITNQAHPLLSSVIEADRIQGMKASFFDEEMEDENWGPNTYNTRPDAYYAERKDACNGESMLKTKKAESFTSDFNKKQKYLDEVYERTYPSIPMSVQWSEFGAQNSMSSLSISMTKLPESLENFPIVKGSQEEESSKKALPFPLGKIYVKAFHQSSLCGKQHLKKDAAYFVGRSCRVGWACDGSFAYPMAPQQLDARAENPLNVLKYLLDSPKYMGQSSFTVTMRHLTSSGLKDNKIIGKVIVDALELQLADSLSTLDGGITLFVPKPGVKPIQALADKFVDQLKDAGPFAPQTDFLRQCVAVWDLLVSLWGNIRGLDDQSATSYAIQMARREALSNWLIKATDQDNSKMTTEIKGNSYLKKIFFNLCGRQTEDAVKLATQNKDFRLSLLLSQAESHGIFRKLIAEQLLSWKQNGSYDFIKNDRLILYAVLAGMLVYEDVNCCSGLNWKQTLALHLWYQCSPNASVQDAVKRYDDAYQGTGPDGTYAAPPNPLHVGIVANRTEEESSVFDTCYHLLKLYCDRSHRLELLLMPETYSPDHLDYRLSWLLHLSLSSLGYNIPDGFACSLHMNFASQLEVLDLWHWAVFVLLHHVDDKWREKQVKDLLLRHVSLESSLEMAEKEKFLTERLQIPKKWIFIAKAIKAKSMGKKSEEAWFLLQAGSWSESHRIVMKYLAAEAVITEDYDYLLKYLDELAPPDRSCTILNWANGGQVYLDYINMCRVLKEVISREASAYDLEKFTPEVISMCKRLSSIPTSSLKDRLSVAEMAKKTATILRSISILQASRTKNNTLTSLASYVKHLPMPYDYAEPEYRFVAHQFLDEVVQDV